MSSEESEQLIIDNWNKTINKRDKIFILGDISMEKPEVAVQFLKKLKGVIEIIPGNHDIKSIKSFVENGFKVSPSRLYKEFWLSHFPIHPLQVENVKGNIHGHIHVPGFIEDLGEYKPVIDLGKKYFNVNVEFNNYTPINFEEIRKYFNN